MRSGALSISVPSRSKTTVSAFMREWLPVRKAPRKFAAVCPWAAFGAAFGVDFGVDFGTGLGAVADGTGARIWARRPAAGRLDKRAFLRADRVPDTDDDPMDAEQLKRDAALRALDFVRSGMKLGLGTGSTARHLVDALGSRVRAGFDVVCVPTSEATRAQAERYGIPLTTLDETPALDLTIDGADEIAPDLSLIKGGGGALLREKIVATASARMIVIADASKWVETLGRFPLPVEVVPFGLEATRRAVEAAAAASGCPGAAVLRRTKEGHPFVTDGGHLILDAALGRIAEPASLSARLVTIPGVVEHGLFVHVASLAIIAGSDGLKIVEPH